jgi:hypothetical protein
MKILSTRTGKKDRDMNSGNFGSLFFYYYFKQRVCAVLYKVDSWFISSECS